MTKMTETKRLTDTSKGEHVASSCDKRCGTVFLSFAVITVILAILVSCISLEKLKAPREETHETTDQTTASKCRGAAVLLLILITSALVRAGLARLFDIEESGETSTLDYDLIPHLHDRSGNTKSNEIAKDGFHNRSKPSDFFPSLAAFWDTNVTKSEPNKTCKKKITNLEVESATKTSCEF